MKVFGQLEKAQLENTTSDTASHPKGMITYRTDLNQAKVSNGTTYKLLIDEDSTQTLSNKTYANPSITGAITAAQTTTPANPASGSNKLYFKADGKLYTLDSSGNEAMVGSGTGGVKNLITNGNADDTSSSIFVPYADAASTRPVDGTGGSPTVTTSMTSSTPLDGAKSFLLTKPASNVQGQGWSVPFTVDPAYRAKSLKISVDYIVNSGTFVAGGSSTESDIIWYIYDVTNSQLIEPSNIKMFSNSSSISDKFEATFQSSATGSSYRLIAHVQSVSALAYELKVDNITVSPQTYVFGNPISDWVSFTPTGTWVTNTTYTGKWRRVGDKAEYKILVTTTGTPTLTTLFVNLAPGHVIDTTKLPASSPIPGNTTIGFGGADNAGVRKYGISVAYNSTTSVAPQNTEPGTGGNAVNDSTPFTFGASDTVDMEFTVPIVGWSSSVQMSDSADTRVFALKYNSGGGQQNISNSTTTTVTQFTNKDFDTHAAFNTSTGILTALTEGFYQISAGFQFGTNSTGIRLMYFTPSGGQQILADYQTGNASIPVQLTGSGTFYLKAGQTLKVEVFQSSGGTLANTTDATGTFIHVNKVSGPSAIASSETVAARYYSTAAAAIPNSEANYFPTTKDYDTHGAYNTSVGFTCPIAGLYRVKAQYITAAFSTGATMVIRTQKNGVNQSIATAIVISGASANWFVGTEAYIRCNAGDVLKATRFVNAGSPVEDGLAASNFVEFTRIGD